MRDFYEEIFKRKSFHLFRDTGSISEKDLEELDDFLKEVKPLDETIRYTCRIVKESETTCKRGAEYCILFYSEKKNEYLRNIGYIGEQIDLYLTSKNIGTLWFGIGKPDEKEYDGLDYIIMIAFSRMTEDRFRKDMFKSKRKSLEETWIGEELPFSDIVRFTPSACNTQPWITEHIDNKLYVYRYKKAGKRGIMPVKAVMYYNRIDIGIYLCILEMCLNHENISYERQLHEDLSDDTVEKTLVAVYTLK